MSTPGPIRELAKLKREGRSQETKPVTTLDTKKILTRNTAWNYVGFVVNLATNLLVFPFVVHGLGDAAAGIWLLLSSVTGYMGLLELGIVPSLSQTVASALGSRDQPAVDRAASTSLVMLLGLSAIPLALTAFVPVLTGLLAIPPGMERESVIVFRVAIIGFALRMPLAMLQALLLGSQRQDRCSQLWILIGLAKCIAAFVVIRAGHGLLALVTAEATIHLVAGLFQYRWVSQELPDLKLSWKLANIDVARKVVGFGGALLAIGLCSLIIEQTDRLVIASFLPLAEVTYYSAGWKIYMLAYFVTTTLVQALTPIAASLHGRGDRAALATLFLRMTKYVSALAWPLVFTLSFCAEFLLKIWMGESYTRAASIVIALAISFAVTAYNHAGYSILTGTRRIGPTFWINKLPQAVLNLALSLLLVRRMGILGVALGTLVPAIVLQYPLLRFMLRELDVSWHTFWSSVVKPTAIPAFLAFAPLAAAYWTIDRQSPFMLVVAIVCSLIYVGCFWRWSLTRTERAVLLVETRNLRQRLSPQSGPAPEILPGS